MKGTRFPALKPTVTLETGQKTERRVGKSNLFDSQVARKVTLRERNGPLVTQSLQLILYSEILEAFPPWNA